MAILTRSAQKIIDIPHSVVTMTRAFGDRGDMGCRMRYATLLAVAALSMIGISEPAAAAVAPASASVQQPPTHGSSVSGLILEPKAAAAGLAPDAISQFPCGIQDSSTYLYDDPGPVEWVYSDAVQCVGVRAQLLQTYTDMLLSGAPVNAAPEASCSDCASATSGDAFAWPESAGAWQQVSTTDVQMPLIGWGVANNYFSYSWYGGATGSCSEVTVNIAECTVDSPLIVLP